MTDRRGEDIRQLFQSNRAWAARIREQDPEFFLKLSAQQSPRYLWIGCADSRVPASEIVDLMPGELFVHRNIANLVVHTDLNCLSVIQFAVDVLKVEHVNVCSTTIVQEAWERDQALAVHGWVYGLRDGLIKDLDVSVTRAGELEAAYGRAVSRLSALP